MAAIYTRRLCALVWNDGVDHPLITVPGGTTWVVRDLVLTNLGSAAESYDVYVVGTPGGMHLFRGSVPSNQSVHVDMRQALEPGDTIGTYRFTAGPSSLMITGYEFLT